MLGANDILTNIPLATSQSNLTTICGRIRAAGADPRLIVPFVDRAALNPTYASTWAQTAAMYYAVADASNRALIDLLLRWQYPSLVVNAAPYSYTDGLHHSTKGYADLSSLAANAIAAL